MSLRARVATPSDGFFFRSRLRARVLVYICSKLQIIAAATNHRTRNRNRMLELRDFVQTNNRQIADLISSKLLEDYDEADGM